MSGGVWEMAIDPLRPAIVYAVGWDGVFKSVNGGRTWRTVNDGLGETKDFAVADLAIDPQLGTTIYAATPAGVFRSTDGAERWQAFSDGLDTTRVSALAIDVSGRTLYAGTANGVVDYRFPR